MSDIEEKEPTPQEIEELSVAELFEHYPHIGLEKIRNLKGWKVDHKEAKTRVHPSITESRKREELRKALQQPLPSTHRFLLVSIL